MSDEVEAFLSSLPEEVERIARALRGRIRDVVPEAVEKRHGGWKSWSTAGTGP